MMTGLRLRILSFPVVAILLASCGPYDEYKQFETFRDMQIIGARLAAVVKESGLELSLMEDEILKVNNGKDAWARELILEIDTQQNSFVLVSLGSDGKAQFDEPSGYFDLEPSEIHDTPAADIVFRDGDAVTYAGK